ncbi:MAG: hypothetical protein IK095_05660 [Oscillospiraceae bacterium]|nr:hypothetical protein [Oscillospiraceae bacterium]
MRTTSPRRPAVRGGAHGAARLVPALLILALCLGLCACGAVPPGGRGDGAEPEPAPLIPEATLPVGDPFAGAPGRWQSADGRLELWIAAADETELIFSLFAPGRASLDLVTAQREGGLAAFLYQDPVHAGDFANGRLHMRDGVPCLGLTGTDMDLPGGQETAFPVRLDAPGYDALYAPVLAAYREHEEAGGGLVNWYGDEEGWVHVGLTGAERYGYTIRDLDRNGVPELILGVLCPEQDGADSSQPDPASYGANLILDLYTLVDGAPTYIVNSGDRYRYCLTDDGLIQYEGSGGAAYSTAALLRLDGAELAISTAVCIAGGEDRCFRLNSMDDYEHAGDEAISYEDFAHISHMIYHYPDSHLCPLQPMLIPVVPAAPAGDAEGPGAVPEAGEAAVDEIGAPSSASGGPYREILAMYAALQTLPYSRMSAWDIATPPTWQMLEQRYSVYHDDSPFLPCAAFYDLDGNGSAELFIGLQGPDGDVVPAEVYSSDGIRAYRIGCAGTRGMRLGGGRLLLEGGRSFPCGEILGLAGDGHTPVQLLVYETLPADPDATSWSGDESSLGSWLDLVQGGEARPYSELKEQYLDGMVPAEELLSFSRIEPSADPPAVSPALQEQREAYGPLLELYAEASRGENDGAQLDAAVMAVLRKNLNDTGRHELCYAWADADGDGTEELFVGYPFGKSPTVACYHRNDDGTYARRSPARAALLRGACDWIPWRYLGGYPVPGVINED